jgi:hypothetical protein
VRKGDAGLKAWVTDGVGYRGGEEFKIKSRQSWRTVTVTGEDGRAHDVRVDIKQVAFWSADYDTRAKAERAAVLMKSEKMVESAGAYTHTKRYGAARYVGETPVNLETGEVMDAVREIDLEAITEAERYDGYYCIITSETDWTDEQIIECYRGLWRIEETFRITKSDLECRPVYVSLEDHIEAHFLECYVALVLLRLIQADTTFRHSVASIIRELGQLECSHLKESWWHFDYRSHVTDELCALAGIDLSKEVMALSQIRSTLAAARKG